MGDADHNSRIESDRRITTIGNIGKLEPFQGIRVGYINPIAGKHIYICICIYKYMSLLKDGLHSEKQEHNNSKTK